jgi:hypothetical protein
VASALAYLDNGVVYVGAKGGDSQIIKLHAEPVTPAAGRGVGFRAWGLGLRFLHQAERGGRNKVKKR